MTSSIATSLIAAGNKIGRTMSLPKPNVAGSVIITGASSGIGAEFARGLSRLGYRPVLVARRVDRLRELAGELARDP
jgi:short-subunit dehydrogenase